MSEAKHTPGPWVVDTTVALGAYGVWTEVATHPGHDGAGYPSPICHMPMGSEERKLVTGSKEARNANAALIAAAPDLLASLETARHELLMLGYRGGIMDLIDATIAKVKGRA